jgi:hypothetical protein
VRRLANFQCHENENSHKWERNKEFEPWMVSKSVFKKFLKAKWQRRGLRGNQSRVFDISLRAGLGSV